MGKVNRWLCKRKKLNTIPALEFRVFRICNSEQHFCKGLGGIPHIWQDFQLNWIKGDLGIKIQKRRLSLPAQLLWRSLVMRARLQACSGGKLHYAHQLAGLPSYFKLISRFS